MNRSLLLLAAALLAAALLAAGCGKDRTGSPTGTSASRTSGSTASGASGCEPSAARASTTVRPPKGFRARISSLRTLKIDVGGGKKVPVKVETADDEIEQSQGLMYRKCLGEDRGMLFVFGSPQVQSFWMKNTLIPLSIAFIGPDRKIIDLKDMRPLDDEPPDTVSSGPAKYALEVNKGFFRKHGVRVGDRVELPKGKNRL